MGKQPLRFLGLVDRSQLMRLSRARRIQFMDILRQDYRWRWDEWEEQWPLRHPESSDYIRLLRGRTDDPKLRRLHERAQERANRRWERKWMKAARAQGVKKRDQMPGAWPI